MNIQEYIISDVTPLKMDDDVQQAQKLFQQLTFSHIPVMDQELYQGCVSETDVYCFEDGQSLRDVKYALDTFMVQPDTHWLDVLEAFAQHNSNVMPVLNDKNEYLGYYELKDIMQHFSDSPFLYESGAVIVVEKGSTDYSFSEIAQIVESNGSKIFGCFVSNYRDHITEITVKVSPDNMNALLQTFRRYSYVVLSAAEDDSYLDALKDRSDYLDKYLNI
ncbi:CBS domain-containing protein [Nonlabens sp. Hel1_33_55]|uniref:CBS domain-containing protein n=1 Tax=Nonlabens sp. Hel1_33_55 TaxID=1336802 RepID=UPI000875D389|nr:CBS domain-containing protein [Nonlabens sp. Hel1_33_55]SCY37397.1 CBS domain-containing protein [Nonlabens sp. Hel1_33_55]